MRQIPSVSPIEAISKSKIFDHLHALEGVRDPETAPEATRTAAAYLHEQMRSSGLDVEKQEIDPPDGPLFPNLIGHSRKRPPDQPILVIGAHYDTVASSPGADDNASSLAALLEAARVLAPMRGSLPLEFVAFSLEERGYVGSEYYLKEAIQHQMRIRGAIILECVGFTDSRPGSQRTPPGLPISLPDQGNFIGLVGNEPTKPIQAAFESTSREFVRDLPVISLLVPDAGKDFPDTRRSDHVPFWDRGIPAIMLTDTAEFRNPHYHQASDRVETLDISFIARVARALTACVIKLADLDPGRGRG